MFIYKQFIVSRITNYSVLYRSDEYKRRVIIFKGF